jgi:hypothetical protein
MEIPHQIELLDGFDGYIDVFDINHPIPVTMAQITGDNPPMFVSLIVKNHYPKLQNLDDYLINDHFPGNLIDLNCDNNLLTLLPPLPEEMEFLSCNNNLITNFTSLPGSLQYIYCNNNKLSVLPQLPEELVILSCKKNKLVSLPRLDNLENLLNLECSHNKLTVLPNLPVNDLGLTTLNCSNNRLQGLPNLPENLGELNCYKNSIYVLPNLPTNLKKLNCSFNQINSLSILPNNLEKLNISNNPIIGSIANISLPSALRKLYCHNCQITDLPPILPSLLEDFKCDNNAINNLPAVLPNGLKRFNCSNNGLTVLPHLPDSLRELYCRGNNFDDESINKIIAFYQRAIVNGFPITNPTFQEELDYFQIHRSKTFINTFDQTPQGSKGQFITNKQGLKLKSKPIPGRAMRKIMAYGNLPYPPTSNKSNNNPLGGKTRKHILKKSYKLYNEVRKKVSKRRGSTRKKSLKKMI